MNNKKVLIPLAALALFGGAITGIATSAAAQTAPATGASTAQTTGASHAPMNRGVAGTIVSINGNTITLTGSNGSTYTVDASKATISKTTTIDVSGLAVGDTLLVGGTVNGTSVTATHIMSGNLPTGSFGGKGGAAGHGGMTGRGQGVMGTVSAVNGDTITVTGKNGTSYTVNATSATKVMKGSSVAGTKPSAVSVSSIAVGDTISARGTLTGTSVAAISIFDGVFHARAPKTAAPATTSTTQ